MISLETKTETSLSPSLTPLVSKEETKLSSLSFAELLSGVKSQPPEEVQNSSIVLALDAKEKNRLPLELNPELTKSFTTTELKGLLSDAKKYLKNKILESVDFKKSEIVNLPKTVKGLAQVAQKFGIDVSKITLESLSSQTHSKVELHLKKTEVPQLVAKSELFAKQKESQIVPKFASVDVDIQEKTVTPKSEVVTKTVEKPKEHKGLESLLKNKLEQKIVPTEVQANVKSESVSKESPVSPKFASADSEIQEKKITSKSEVVTKVVEKPQERKGLESLLKNKLEQKIVPTEVQEKVKSERVTPVIKETQKAPKFASADAEIQEKTVTPKSEIVTKTVEKPQESKGLESLLKNKLEQKVAPTEVPKERVKEVQQNVKSELVTPVAKEIQKSIQPELQKMPLFKTETSRRVSTQELVQTKTARKVNSDATLSMLLRGEKVTQKEPMLTTDFSVATARVIAPQTPTKGVKSLESLLKGDGQESTHLQKTDGFNVGKAEPLDVKLHEAKQMTKYISQDVKSAINDYKSPFTRVKVQLNPERLGSVELTVVQRGKNLHINLSSNNAAINALAMNANDLKLQLTNNGINNATLNFNNNSQGSEAGSFGQEHQNPQQRRDAQREYNYFDNEEQHEESINSLEIVVPSYA